MRSVTCAIGAALFLASAGLAAADDGAPAYRAVIDRVDLEPASIGGLRLRIELSALALQGQVLDLSDPKAIKTTVGGSKLDAPYAIGSYAATGADTAIVIVVQANLPYAEALPSILSALDDNVLSSLGERTQIAILPFGDATGSGKLSTIRVARSKLPEIIQDGSPAEPALLDTIDRALLLLKRAKTQPEGRPLRKMVIVISDGHDRAGDTARVTSVGIRADKAGIRIHAFGYAPSKVLRPLLTLGELSKRSLGTFRWVRSGGTESWGPAFLQLRNEINQQYVLTYFLPSDADVAGKKVKIVTVGRTEASSKEITIPQASCGSDPCPTGYCSSTGCVPLHASGGRGVLGWILLIVGSAIGLVVILGLVGFVLQRRQAAAGANPGVPGQPGVPAAEPGKRAKPPKGQPIAPPVAIPTTGPALLVMSGPRTGERIPLQHGFTIGKAPGSTLLLDDGYTSGQHAHITVDQIGTWRLYDRNSTNGTFVNGVRITDTVLDHGMSVRIGSTELRFLAQ